MKRKGDDKAMYIMTEIKQTCGGCPSQWEGKLDDGKIVYVRYRWGCLSVSIGDDLKETVMGEQIFGEPIGEGLDGYLEYSELKQACKGVIQFPEEQENGLPQPKEKT